MAKRPVAFNHSPEHHYIAFSLPVNSTAENGKYLGLFPMNETNLNNLRIILVNH